MSEEINGRGKQIADAIYGKPLTRQELNIQLAYINQLSYFIATKPEGDLQRRFEMVKIKIQNDRNDILKLLEITK